MSWCSRESATLQESLCGRCGPIQSMWHGLSDDGRLSGGCRARADRLHQSRAACGWQPHVEVLTTVTFAEQGGKTKQILHARVIKMTAQAAPYLKGMEAGWTQSLERLAESLAKA